MTARAQGALFGLFATVFLGDLLDISRLGLRFVTDDKIALGSQLRLVVTFGRGEGTLICTGGVRWSHAHEVRRFVAGVEFDAMREEQEDLLDRVLKPPSA